MDSSLQSAHLNGDELHASQTTEQAEVESMREEGEHHIHLPNPSLWPFILSVAILVLVAGLLFIPANFWISLIAAPFVLIGIMGWALEDPMAPKKELYVMYPARKAGETPSKFSIGQDVLDSEGHWVGTVQARFARYILVERGGLFVTAYYVPVSVTKDPIKNNIVRLSLSEDELRSREMNNIPDDLYDETPDLGVPRVTGVPLFARGPLSPAQTGHYNYGPNYPGINTDASGSYHREEVAPIPQRYVGEELYVTSRTIPSRAISPD